MQQGIKKLQWFEYFKVVFLEILNAGLCRVFANQVTYNKGFCFCAYCVKYKNATWIFVTATLVLCFQTETKLGAEGSPTHVLYFIELSYSIHYMHI